MEFILTMLSAFLGGTCALIGQWYIFRNEKYSTRRKVLYYLLEIYGNVYKLKKLKTIEEKYSKALISIGIPEDDAKDIKSKFLPEVNQEVYSDVFDELDELNEHYPKIVDELSKENPTLAYYISGHAKSLDKMMSYLERITAAIKQELPENDHGQIDQVFETLFQNDFVDLVVADILSSINLVSKNISIVEEQRVAKVLLSINDFSSDDSDIEERIKSIIGYIESQTSSHIPPWH